MVALLSLTVYILEAEHSNETHTDDSHRQGIISQQLSLASIQVGPVTGTQHSIQTITAIRFCKYRKLDTKKYVKCEPYLCILHKMCFVLFIFVF